MKPGSPEFDRLLDELERDNDRMQWFIKGIGAGFGVYEDVPEMSEEEFNRWVRSAFAERLHGGDGQ